MEIRKFKNTNELQGLEDYEIVNDCQGTRSGFKHVSRLFHYGNEIETATCYYLNRTWECYTYQTSMKSVISKHIDAIKDRIVYYYKQDNNVARITKKHKEAIQKLYDEDKRIDELKELYKQLDNRYSA